jgi:hypothetical protein
LNLRKRRTSSSEPHGDHRQGFQVIFENQLRRSIGEELPGQKNGDRGEQLTVGLDDTGDVNQTSLLPPAATAIDPGKSSLSTDWNLGQSN